MRDKKKIYSFSKNEPFDQVAHHLKWPVLYHLLLIFDNFDAIRWIQFKAYSTFLDSLGNIWLKREALKKLILAGCNLIAEGKDNRRTLCMMIYRSISETWKFSRLIKYGHGLQKGPAYQLLNPSGHERISIIDYWHR